MVHDPDFWSDANLNYVRATIVAGVESVERGAGTTVGGVHTFEELSLLRAAANTYMFNKEHPAETSELRVDLKDKLAAQLAAQRTVFMSLVASALRREFDAIFGWTARPAETLLLRAISPAFGELAAKLPPVDAATAEQLALSRLQLGESLEANANAMRHLKMIENAYGALLEDVFVLVGDKKKQQENEEKKAGKIEIF